MKRIDLSGKRFGRWQVISHIPVSGKHTSLWLCKCDCGTAKTVASRTLRNGSSTSCGCFRYELQSPSLVGMRFSFLVVMKRYAHQKLCRSGPKTQWICRCDCGQLATATTGELKSSRKKSCGCAHRTRGGRSDTPEGVMWHAASYRARKQGVPFTISIDDIRIPDHCPVCERLFRSGKNVPALTAASLDKIEPANGYVPGNILVVCRECNLRKRDLSLSEWRRYLDKWQKAIAQYANADAASKPPQESATSQDISSGSPLPPAEAADQPRFQPSTWLQ